MPFKSGSFFYAEQEQGREKPANLRSEFSNYSDEEDAGGLSVEREGGHDVTNEMETSNNGNIERNRCLLCFRPTRSGDAVEAGIRLRLRFVQFFYQSF